MSQLQRSSSSRTARQSLEQAFEHCGLQTEGPHPAPGLQELARSSVQDQVSSPRVRLACWRMLLLPVVCSSPITDVTTPCVCHPAPPLQSELIQACAQEERERRHKLKKASKQQAAHAAEALFSAPAGLSGFATKLLQVCMCVREWFASASTAVQLLHA